MDLRQNSTPDLKTKKFLHETTKFASRYSSTLGVTGQTNTTITFNELKYLFKGIGGTDYTKSVKQQPTSLKTLQALQQNSNPYLSQPFFFHDLSIQNAIDIGRELR